MQVTATLVTSDAAIVPDPLHVCPGGSVLTVTAYAAPAARAVGNVNDPSADTVTSSPPLSSSTTGPDSPDTVPPTE